MSGSKKLVLFCWAVALGFPLGGFIWMVTAMIFFGTPLLDALGVYGLFLQGASLFVVPGIILAALATCFLRSGAG